MLQWTGEGADTTAMRMTETVSTLMQGVVFAELALNYDQALYVDQTYGDADIDTVTFSDRVVIRVPW